MCYDALLILALWMVTTALLLPVTDGEAITPESAGVLEHLYRLVLLGIVVAYLGYSWTRTGQTLGMAAWRLKLLRNDDGLPSWRDASWRLAGAAVSLAAFGLGYLWILVDPGRRAWHDRWSGTRVVVVPKS